MDGILFLDGYKLKHRICLNLQKHTIITSHSDMFTPTTLFDLIERYFAKQNFSDIYLQQGIHICLNEKTLSPSALYVKRIRPIVNLEEEIKIVKKTLLGQYLEQIYHGKEDIFSRISSTVETELLQPLNTMLSRYGVRASCDEQNIFNLAKMLTIGTYQAEDEVMLGEHSQLQSKKLILELMNALVTSHPKLLLVELPEYGLDKQELHELFATLIELDQIENSIIYTQSKEILHYIEDIYAYHLCKDYRIMGFDDYDEMEEMILDFVCRTQTSEQIKKTLLTDLFDEQTYQRKYETIDAIFRK